MVDQNPNTQPERRTVEPPPPEVFNPLMDEGIVDENNMDTKGRDGWHRPPLVDYPEETEMVVAAVRNWGHDASHKRAKERELELAHATRNFAGGEFSGETGEALQRLLAPTTKPRDGEERNDKESDRDFKDRIAAEREKKTDEKHRQEASQHPASQPRQPSHTGPEEQRHKPDTARATGPEAPRTYPGNPAVVGGGGSAPNKK